MMVRPYHEGVLRKEWLDYLSAQDFSRLGEDVTLAELWGAILEDFPLNETIKSRGEQIGTYLNAIHWDKVARLGEDLVNLKAPSRTFDNSLKCAQAIRRGGEGFQGVELSAFDDRIFDLTNQEPSHNFRPSTLKGKQTERSTILKEHADLIDYVKSIKTGSMSVCNPEGGVASCELPLGDATMLPVLKIKDLKYVGNWTRQMIGYNPTNAGFQGLQEAYQRGDWDGETPRIRRSKRRCRFEVPESSRSDAALSARTRSRAAEERARSNNAGEDTVPMEIHPPDEQAKQSQTPAPDSSPHGPTTTARTNAMPDSTSNPGTITFCSALTPSFVDGVNKNLEKIRNGGRAQVEAEFKEMLRLQGLVLWDDDEEEEEEEEEESDEDETKSEDSGSVVSYPSPTIERQKQPRTQALVELGESEDNNMAGLY